MGGGRGKGREREGAATFPSWVGQELRLHSSKFQEKLTPAEFGDII